MAATKAELKRALAQKHLQGAELLQELVCIVEKVIDGALRREYIDNNLVRVQIDGPLDPKVQAEIEYRYREAGWTISFHNVPPNSYWIELE